MKTPQEHREAEHQRIVRAIKADGYDAMLCVNVAYTIVKTVKSTFQGHAITRASHFVHLCQFADIDMQTLNRDAIVALDRSGLEVPFPSELLPPWSHVRELACEMICFVEDDPSRTTHRGSR